MPKTLNTKLFDTANRLWDSGNPQEALSLFLKAAKHGDISAKISVGYFYDLGIGVVKNSHKALFWYKKAAQDGDWVAFANIATVFRDWNNFWLARQWYLKAIRAGDGDAACDLGKLYLKIFGTRKIPEAAKYFRIAVRSKYITEMSRDEAKRLLSKPLRGFKT